MIKIKNVFLVLFVLFVCITSTVSADSYQNQTININYNDNFNVPQITSTSNLEFTNVVFNITNNMGDIGTGKYLIASAFAGDTLTFTGLSVLNNSKPIDLTDKNLVFEQSQNNPNELMMWYYLKYWGGNDNSFMQYNGFECVGNNCVLTVDKNLINFDIKNVNNATLNIESDIKLTTSSINLSGNNILNIINDGKILLDTGIIQTGLWTGNINNSETSIITSKNQSVLSLQNFNGNIINNGIIGKYQLTYNPLYAISFMGNFNGNITNGIDGLISGFNSAVYSDGGRFNGIILNNGNITSSLNSAIDFNNMQTSSGMILKNYGNITGALNGVNFTGIYNSGNIENYGNITSGRFGGGKGINIDISGSYIGSILNDNSSAEITGGSGGIFIKANIWKGDISNLGTISSLSNSGVEGYGIEIKDTAFGGNITNKIDANIKGSFAGLYFNGGTYLGNIENRGNIIAENPDYFGILFGSENANINLTNQNSGVITGIKFNNSFVYGDIFNYGNITGQGLVFTAGNTLGTFGTRNNISQVFNEGLINGITFKNQNAFFKLSNFGQITGLNYGINFDNSKFESENEITNQFGGKITGANYGIYTNSEFNGKLTNAGEIVGNDGIFVGGKFSGNILNTETGVIQGSNFGIHLSDFFGTIKNDGIISGLNGGIVIDGIFSSNMLLENKGQITGGIYLNDNFSGTINNYGIIDDINFLTLNSSFIHGLINNYGNILSINALEGFALTGINNFGNIDLINLGKIINNNVFNFEETSVVKNFVLSGNISNNNINNKGIINNLSFVNTEFFYINNITNFVGGEITNIDLQNITLNNGGVLNINNAGNIFSNLTFIDTGLNRNFIINITNTGLFSADYLINADELSANLNITNNNKIISNISVLNIVNSEINSGLVKNNSVMSSNNNAIFINNSVLNNFTIENTSSLTSENANAIDISSTSFLNGSFIKNTGNIIGNTAISLKDLNGQNSLNIINSGNISSTVGSGIDISNSNFQNYELFTFYFDSMTDGNLSGINFDTVNLMGNLSLFGKISGNTLNGITFNNSNVLGYISNGGEITGYKNGFYINFDILTQFNGNITNSGTVKGLNENGILLNNTIFANNINTNNITGYLSGISLNNSVFNGSIINNGNITGQTISGIQINASSSFGVLSSVISNKDASIIGEKYGIDIQGLYQGIVKNAGYIFGKDTGVNIVANFGNGAESFKNENTGTIQGNNYGVYIDGINFSGNFNNAGKILSDKKSLYITDSVFNGYVINSGTINSGLYIKNTDINGGLNNSGNIFDNINAVEIDGGILKNTVNNSGTMYGGKIGLNMINSDINLSNFVNSGIIRGNDYGIYINNNTINSFIFSNTGTVISNGDAFYFGENSVKEITISNINGIISGKNTAIKFNDLGDNILNYTNSKSATSQVIGNIDMGLGLNDSVNFYNSNLSSVYVVNAENINLKQTVISLKYPNPTMFLNNPIFKNENGFLNINVENNVIVNFDTYKNKLKLGDKFLIARSGSGITLTGQDLEFDLGDANKFFGIFEIQGNDLYFILNKVFFQINKINTSIQTAFSSVRRSNDVILNRQINDIYVSNMKKDLSVDFAASNYYAYDFSINNLYKMRKNGFWFEYLNGKENYKSQGSIKEISSAYEGFILGYDRVSGNMVLGASFSYGASDGSVTYDYAITDKSYKGSLYGSYNFGNMYMFGNIGYAKLLNTTDINGEAEIRETEGDAYFGNFTLGKMYNYKKLAILPYTKLDITSVNYEEEKANSYIVSAGFDLKYGILLPARHKIIPTLYYSAGFELSNDFVSSYDITFDKGIQPYDFDYDLGKLINKFGAKISFIERRGTTIDFGVEKVIRQNYDSMDFRGSVNFKF